MIPTRLLLPLKTLACLPPLVLMSIATAANATSTAPVAPPFFDNFDDSPWTRGEAPTGWAGTDVDVHGAPDDVDYLDGTHGHVVDLVGTHSGTLSKTFSLTAGLTYVATYTLTGNHRAEILTNSFGLGADQLDDTVDVSFGEATTTHVLAPDAAITSYTLAFTPEFTGDFDLTFHNRPNAYIGSDLIGAMLLDVRVAAVPEPSTAALFAIAGVFALGVRAAGRQRR